MQLAKWLQAARYHPGRLHQHSAYALQDATCSPISTAIPLEAWSIEYLCLRAGATPLGYYVGRGTCGIHDIRKSIDLENITHFEIKSFAAVMMAPLIAGEKYDHVEEHHSTRSSSITTPFNSRARRALLILLTIALPLYLLGKYFGFSTSSPEGSNRYSHHASYTQTAKMNQSALVPLEAHIMSQCPDARDCLRDLVVPAMERVSDHVNFKLSFIGR